MRRGDFSEKEIQLIKMVEGEFELFKYHMLSKSRKKIFESYDAISFYSCIHRYFVYPENIEAVHINACLKCENIIADLYRIYTEYGYLRYGHWEDIVELLNVLMREQEDYRGQEDPES